MNKKRFFILGNIILLFMLIFIGTLVNLQIIQHRRYTAKVEDLVSKQNRILSLRGRIFDRNADEALAYNISVYKLFIVPFRFPAKQRGVYIKNLASILPISEEKIQNAFKKKNANTSYTLMSGLSYEEIVRYVESLNDFPGVDWSRETKREYRLGSSMAHILGYVGDISVSEFQLLRDKNYLVTDKIGKSGVEKQYEDELRGISGRFQQSINVFGQDIEENQQLLKSAKPGYDIVLTIDKKIQDIVEKALGERVGAAVVLKPNTGEILAMASYPRYNPNVLINAKTDDVISDIENNSNFPFLNRAIQASASPASTFKPLMATAFLQENPRSWGMTVFDKGYIVIGNRRFYDWVRTGHGRQNIFEAIANSCNVFFYTIGTQKLNANIIADYAVMFGLGQLTNIDLPWESAGVVPSPQWKERRYGEKWQLGDTANFSIGQGYLATTPLQLAQMTAGLVNNGVQYRPYLLKEIRNQITGEIVKKTKPQVLRTIDGVDAKVFKKVKEAMRGVVTVGTAKSVLITKAVDIAAKTGTGQTNSLDKNLHSWLISFAPYNADPKDQIVVVVWIDSSNEWEWWGPKATNIIYDAIFSNATYEETITKLKKQRVWYL